MAPPMTRWLPALFVLAACSEPRGGAARRAHVGTAAPGSSLSSSSAPPAAAPTSAASVAAASEPVPPARLPPPTAAQISGKCTAADPIEIGTSTDDEPGAGGPGVAVRASRHGAIAAFQSSSGSVTVVPLGLDGQPKSSGRKVGGTSRFNSPRLWELGNGSFVLGTCVTVSGCPPSFVRVEASGDIVGTPARFAKDMWDVKSANYRGEELAFLTVHLKQREIVGLSAAADGLALRRAPLPEPPASDTTVRKHRLLFTAKGEARVVAYRSDGSVDVEADGRPRVSFKLPKDFDLSEPQISPSDEIVWARCFGKPPHRALRVVDGAPQEIEVGASYCPERPSWGVSEQLNSYDGKYKGVAFGGTASQPLLWLHREDRATYRVDTTWTGTHVLGIYAKRKAGGWSVFVHAVSCEGTKSG